MPLVVLVSPLAEFPDEGWESESPPLSVLDVSELEVPFEAVPLFPVAEDESLF